MRFRVLSYNIHKAIGVDGRFRPERIVDILRHHNADIVMLQEVDSGVPRSRNLDLARELARALNYEYKAIGLNVTLRKGKYGNATLTRFPIGRQRNIDLTVSWRKPRGAQHTAIRLPFDTGTIPVEIFNIHLGLSALERRRQVRHLLSTPDVAHLADDRVCIIAGDMNDWRGVLRRKHFDDAGFSCATNRHPGSKRSIKTFPSYAPTGGLDKIFYRGPVQLVRVRRSRLGIARVASDHLPVIADFRIAPNGRA